MLERINENDHLLHNLWMSDEAHFHLSGYVNKQNFRYWSDNNPRRLHERPLYSEKVTVWCAISSLGIIGPYFFEDEDGHAVTVNSDRYVHMLNNFFLPAIENYRNEHTTFQQDGATCHTSRVSMDLLRRSFPTRLVSKYGDISWPPRSPDLTLCDNFLWGYLKSKVFQSNPPRTIEALKERIRQEVEAIPQQTLLNVVNSFVPRLQECVRQNGGHLSNIIFKY